MSPTARGASWVLAVLDLSSASASPARHLHYYPTLWRRKPRCAQVTLKSRAAWLHGLPFNSIYCSWVQMVHLGPSYTYLSRKGRQTDRQKWGWSGDNVKLGSLRNVFRKCIKLYYFEWGVYEGREIFKYLRRNANQTTKDSILFTYLIVKMFLYKSSWRILVRVPWNEHFHIQQSTNCINLHGIQFGNCRILRKNFSTFWFLRIPLSGFQPKKKKKKSRFPKRFM